MSCEQPSFFLNSDVVWIEGKSDFPATSAEPAFLTISEVAARFGVTLRTLRFYESRGLLAPVRDGRARLYGRADCDRLALVLKGKKLGFTLVEIGRMVAAEEGRASSQSLRLSREKCLEQIALLEKQLGELEEAIAELRRIHTMLAGKAGAVNE